MHNFLHIRREPLLTLVSIGLGLGLLLTGLSWVSPVFAKGLFSGAAWFWTLTLVGTLLLLTGARLAEEQRYPAMPKPSLLLAVAAATALVYLFPELFAPGCGGMPRAFAACPAACQINTCSDWAAPGERGCDAQPPDKGCCFAYETTCDPACSEPDPDLPPTITKTLTCAVAGTGVWCKSGAVLKLSAADPQNFPTTIKGDIAGASFSCPGPNCSRTLPAGSGTIHFWALAPASGLSSAVGSTTFAFDPTPPTATLLVSGNLASNNWYTTASASATGADAISGLASSLIAVDGGAWKASATLTEGTHSVVGRARDRAGNITLTPARIVKVDATAPAISAAVTSGTLLGSWYISEVVVKAGASDATSGVALIKTRLDGGAWVTGDQATIASDGVHILNVSATDYAGNVASYSMVIRKDATPPALDIPSAPDGSSGWFVTFPTLSLNASDATSGLASALFSNGEATTTLTEDGIQPLNAIALDNAGNTTTANQTIRVDTTAPLLSVSAPMPDGLNGWHLTSPTFSLAASDATSGLASALFDNGQATMAITGDGIFNVEATAKDYAGNTTPYIRRVKQDATPPSLSIPFTPDGSNGWFVTFPTLSLIAKDATSGLASALFSNGKATYPVTSQGVSTVSSQAADYAGNTTSASATVSVDTVPPTLSVSSPAADGLNGWYVTSPTLSLTASDVTSGLASALFSDGKASTTITTDGVYNLSALASDKAGNLAPGGITVKRDATPPSLSIAAVPDGSNGWFVTFPTLSLTASDLTSGLASALFGNGKTTTAITKDGVYPLNATAADNAGNTISASQTIQVDTTAPLLSVTAPAVDGLGGWYVSSPTLSLTASDVTSGLASALFSDGKASTTITTDGVYNLSALASDKAGNLAPGAITVKRDATPPSLSIPLAPDGSNGWFVTFPTLSLIANDATSGLASALFSNGKATYPVTSQGLSTVHSQAADYAGNTVSATATISVDTVPPELSVSAPAADGLNGWYLTSPTLSLAASDATSGLDSAAFEDGSTSMTISVDGIHPIRASAKDRAGNSLPYSTSLKKDATPPSLSIPSAPDGSNGWFITFPTLSLIAKDVTSGLASALFSNGQTTTAITGDGVYPLSATAADQAGNTTSATQTIQVDTTPPLLSIASIPDGLNDWFVTFPTLALSASDATSGLASATFSNGQTTTRLNTDGLYALSAAAADKAGNTSAALKTVQVDTTPPELAISIPYAPDGLNGWYISLPTLSLTSSDATSGLASAAFANGDSSFRATDGTQVVSANAKDKAGNSNRLAQTLKVDVTPPTLTPSISGPGAQSLTWTGGWYNTAVTVSLNALDAISGVELAEYRLDSGNWTSGSRLTVSTEGEHRLEMRATDHAGNSATATRSFKLDTTRPVSAFSNPSEGAQIWVTGTVSLTGASADALSGLAATEISLDGGATWLALPFSDGAWSYTWDTLRVPDGSRLLVHADDLAGNRGNPARVQLLVGNKPPRVEIQPAWWVWNSGYLKVQPSQLPLRDVSVRIVCAPYHPDVVLNFTAGNVPSTLKWDRQCGNGAYAAENGNYTVSLTACDTFGHCAEDTGVIQVPFIAPPVPTWTPTVAPSPTFTPAPTSTPAPTTMAQPSPTAQAFVVALPTLAPSPTPAPAAPRSQPAWLAWLLALLLAILLALAYAAVRDPRPRALRNLGKTLEELARDGQA